MKKGRFRADLFHRLNVYPIHVPALREHSDDIPILAGYVAEPIQRRLGVGEVRFRHDTFDILKSYNWPFDWDLTRSCKMLFTVLVPPFTVFFHFEYGVLPIYAFLPTPVLISF